MKSIQLRVPYNNKVLSIERKKLVQRWKVLKVSEQKTDFAHYC